MWSMHEYINGDKVQNDKDLGTAEFETEEVLNMVINAVLEGYKVYRQEYKYIYLYKWEEDLKGRHCYKFTHISL